MIVTKHPCLWPGDIRRLIAVRNCKLEQCMRDVIVFPINGERPHSNEMSGSDLDGDQYWVYWGDELEITTNIEPLPYQGGRRIDEALIDENKISEHIVQSFGSNFIVGTIGNIHTVVADKHEQHSFSEPCKTLARLFAIAVDSPKTGEFVNMNVIRPYQDRYYQNRPRFMQKCGERQYESNSILEQLFLRAKDMHLQLKLGLRNNNYSPTRSTLPRTSMIINIDKEFKKWLDGRPNTELTLL